MSFFRDYLRKQGQQPDVQFDEDNESWFVFALVLLRIGFPLSYWNLIVGRGKRFRQQDPLADFAEGPEFRNALLFVSWFLCFFIPKPRRYLEEISSFKKDFVPGFAFDYEKQERLFKIVRPEFSRTPLQEATWETVSHYFRTE